LPNHQNIYLIDFHAHLDNSKERLDQLFIAQENSGIEKTVIVSGNLIEPANLGDFLRGTESVKNYEPNNAYLLDVAKANPARLIPFFTVDPSYHIAEDIEEAMKLGFRGFKFNPLVHKIDFRSDSVRNICAAINAYSAPIYTHITLNPASSIEALADLSQAHHKINFVLGHMGYATSDQMALNLAERRDNIYLETSVGSILAFKCAKQRNLRNKVIFGSEYPAHEPSIELGKLALIFSQDDLALIGRANAQFILGI
jgi:predicted TIM-barrel fold metal-dependent hydrolase